MSGRMTGATLGMWASVRSLTSSLRTLTITNQYNALYTCTLHGSPDGALDRELVVRPDRLHQDVKQAGPGVRPVPMGNTWVHYVVMILASLEHE